VESQLGIGSTFHFTIPILSRSYTSGQNQPGNGIPFPSVRPCILLVDPDVTKGALLRHHFQDLEVFQLESISRLDEAIALYQPRAIIVCPPVDAQVVESLSHKRTPVIFSSLPGQPKDFITGQNIQSLLKPVSPEKILSIINSQENIHSVLVVDDERGAVQLVERVIQSGSKPIIVTHAYDGFEGLRMINSHHPDLVFWDNGLQDLSGANLLDKIRQDQELRKTQIVFLASTDLIVSNNEIGKPAFEIHKSGGLKPIETIRCLTGVLNALDVNVETSG
jgi:CheY-like chemotaxis protein